MSDSTKLESFIDCFAIGGVAGVGYNVVTRRPLAMLPRSLAE